MVEGARLESVFRGNSNVGSNPTLSASLHKSRGALPPFPSFPSSLRGQSAMVRGGNLTTQGSAQAVA